MKGGFRDGIALLAPVDMGRIHICPVHQGTCRGGSAFRNLEHRNLCPTRTHSHVKEYVKTCFDHTVSGSWPMAMCARHVPLMHQGSCHGELAFYLGDALRGLGLRP